MLQIICWLVAEVNKRCFYQPANRVIKIPTCTYWCVDPPNEFNAFRCIYHILVDAGLISVCLGCDEIIKFYALDLKSGEK